MSSMVWALSVPLIVFMVVVAPVWLVLHYRAQRRQIADAERGGQAQLQALSERAERLEQRLHTLELLLDQDDPHWRERL
ncbi:envelope stress response membrane protein PspB [Pseudaeromonas sp. ZJS20]|uniref:envelope stress response membrane protein PspB n=1 Tax=Pseudaeromonas aegiceratis TaxID=3153928 RepID=UPI00390C4D5E